MGRIDFSLVADLGNVLVSVILPSFRHESNDVRIGRAKIQVGRMTCAVDVELERKALTAFANALRDCSEKLRGRFSLATSNGSFILEGEMAPNGHARIAVRTGVTLDQQRDDPQWSVSANFACPASSLSKAAVMLQDA